MTTSLRDLGDYVRAAREDQGISQDDLAGRVTPPTNRTAVALLEQGRRLPASATLESLCTHLGVPRRFWEGLLDQSQVTRAAFEEALGELVGRRVSLRDHDEESASVAHDAVLGLFNTSRTEEQLHRAFAAALVNYDVAPPSLAFFKRFLRAEAFTSVDAFAARVEDYQAQAIRLYSSFAAAYEHLGASDRLDDALAPLRGRDDGPYRARTEWSAIEEIPDERLPDLGYISAARVRKEQAERTMVASFLVELADKIEVSGISAIETYTPKKRRKIGSLLRSFRSTLPHDLLSPLFAPDPDLLRREAKQLGPKAAEDIERMESTQATGLRNLARYLTADFMDAYVATSMRSDADFASVNSFVRRLFKHPEVHPLKLRYFNPTQSWIEDRVAKGLVEALMLKRADFTIYLAQKADSFGKDSEASVALGQGKPVIVFVPSLRVPEVDIDSEKLGALGRLGLKQLVEREATGEEREVDETTDDQALLSQVLLLRLQKASGAALAGAAREHWADFDLYGEDSRIQTEAERAAYRAWLDACVVGGKDEGPAESVRNHFIGILVATATNAETRATVFREVHPLALQVILSTGVLNGILVVRSIEGCAAVVGRLVRNALELDLIVDDQNYRLVERSTRSTIRVIARHALIGNAFEAFYKAASQRR
ncbi:MAG: helix-turn-helix domain-containing protein [Sandaracinaceae bacterium]